MVSQQIILAIDPGPEKSGWCAYDGNSVIDSGTSDNEAMRLSVRAGAARMAIEGIASYGMAVGKEVLDTCVWIGRFIECWQNPEKVEIIYRKAVKLFLCDSIRATDANIRCALIDRFGGSRAIGKKAAPGPLYSVKGHAWSALAVAVTAMHSKMAR